MKKMLFVALFTIVLQSQLIAQVFDPMWSGRFQTVLDSVLTADDFRGASLGVFVPGQGGWTTVSGESSVGVPVTDDMRFGIGSNSKLFTAVLIAKLQELGILTLDDPLYQWLPSYQNIDSTITIRQLLSHQSGMADLFRDNTPMFTDSMWADTARFWTPQEILPTLAPPHFSPGHGFFYSNTNYMLAAMVIESATGNSWVQNLHTYIFDPLNLDSTFVGAFETPNGAVAHEWYDGNVTEIVNSPMTSLYSMIHAAGAIFSTANEMVQWYEALFNGIVISGASLQEIISCDPTTLYGLGLKTAPVDYPVYGHDGVMIGYQSFSMYDAKTKSILCILTNGGSASVMPLFFSLLNVLTYEYPKQPDDAGITNVISPWQNSCIVPVLPSVTLTNFGSNPLTSVTINYQADGGTPTTYNWSGILNTGNSATVNLPALITTAGTHNFTCYTSGPNGNAEGYTNNDTAKSIFIIINGPPLTAPYVEGFEGALFPPSGWSENSITATQWGRSSMASHTGANSAAKGNFVDSNIGVNYDLDMPMINLAGISNPALEFEHAYAQYPGKYDFLRILISTDCGISWQSLYYKGGASLSTAPSTYDLFYPNSNQWKRDTISLAAYSGDVIIRFRNTNGNGNNLFIDDVTISSITGIHVTAFIENEIFVYPNPATDLLTIEGIKSNSEIQLLDITGKVITQQKTEDDILILNVDEIPTGVYLVRVNSDGIVATKKVVVSD